MLGLDPEVVEIRRSESSNSSVDAAVEFFSQQSTSVDWESKLNSFDSVEIPMKTATCTDNSHCFGHPLPLVPRHRILDIIFSVGKHRNFVMFERQTETTTSVSEAKVLFSLFFLPETFQALSPFFFFCSSVEKSQSDSSDAVEVAILRRVENVN